MFVLRAMGASLSAEEGPFDRVDAIKEQLFEFESRLSSIEQEHQRALLAMEREQLLHKGQRTNAVFGTLQTPRRPRSTTFRQDW